MLVCRNVYVCVYKYAWWWARSSLHGLTANSHIYVCIHIHLYVCVCVCVCVYVCWCVLVQRHMCSNCELIYVFIQIYLCLCVCIYICTYVYVHACTYIYKCRWWAEIFSRVPSVQFPFAILTSKISTNVRSASVSLCPPLQPPCSSSHLVLFLYLTHRCACSHALYFFDPLQS